MYFYSPTCILSKFLLPCITPAEELNHDIPNNANLQIHNMLELHILMYLGPDGGEYYYACVSKETLPSFLGYKMEKSAYSQGI
jgi:hypothetical protein